MTTTPEPPPGGETPSVDELLSSPELVKAVENDEFKAILDHLPIAVVVSRLHGDEQRIIYANACFEGLIGIPFTEVDRQRWSVLDVFRHEDFPTQPLGYAIAHGEDFLGTFRREREGGSPVLVQAYASRIENDDGTENYRIAALVDVSHQERAHRDEFERRIRDKDLLLKELQHRVKNNLQLITALIRLEARNARHGADIDLDRLAARIEALALLYQALSNDAFGEEIDLGPYLSEIASAVVRAHAVSKIRLDLKVSYCPVSVNVAMPVGLLVNELLTNAFKHAFTDRDSGTVTVECHCLEDGHHMVVVADDGVGFPRGETWPRRAKLSGFILQTLRENAPETDCRVESAPGGGTRVTLSFRHVAPKAN